MNTKILEYIIAIAEEKNITKAAERHLLSSSVLSRHLKKVEGELGSPLFLHEKQGLTLTKAGVIYINSAQAILHAQHQMEQQIETIKHQQKDTMTFLIDPPYLNFFQKEILPVFHEKYPKHYINYSKSNFTHMKAQFLSRKVDLAIFPSSNLTDEKLTYIPLFKESFEIVFSENNPAAMAFVQGRMDDPVFKNLQFVLLESDYTFRHLQNECLASVGLIPRIIFEVTTFHESLDNVIKNNCCTILPSELINISKTDKIRHYPFKPDYCFYAVMAYSQRSTFSVWEHKMLLNIIENFPNFYTYMRKKDKDIFTSRVKAF